MNYFDPLAPKGHLTLNKFYIDNLARAGDLIFVGESIGSYFSNHGEVRTFPEHNLTKGRLIHSIYTFFLGLVCIYIARRKSSNICFLSYDMTNFFALTHIARLFGLKVYSFEHNTSPSGSKIKGVLQSLCSKKLTRFCYTESIKSEFKFKKNIIVIPHPLLKNLSKKIELEPDFFCIKSNYKNVIFCPSATADMNRVESVAQHMPDTLFVVKSKKILSYKNLYIKPFFENYDKMMEIADFVYLPLNDCSRVSGPFFEGVCKGKNILLEKNRFGYEMKKQFPDHVQFIKDVFIKRTAKFDITSYNNRIISLLKETLYG